ncbi:metal ABC transporter ATP-binding protein [Ezakiella peruensis]|uniref:metal ABC transporter ATP-binding protein n=1 Tax=Ezakiella peruensis TaxID=1464038 RepID=UPI000C1B3D3A|nr:metal ABC transporter ATP-binding protein [Ezakiella peruensis]
MNNEIIIDVEDLTLAYNENPVVWDADVEIINNSRTAIIGPNGAGKSTFLKGILGLIKPLAGEVKIMGKNPKDARKYIAYIPQTASVNWDFPTNVLDVVLMGRYKSLGWIKRPGKKDMEIAKEALNKMGMYEYKNRQISELSGGQRQRVFLARAICSDAQIYFMDEPLAGVDMTTEKIIMDTIKEFQANGKTIVAVHHDLNTIKEYFDHVVIINKRVLAYGPMDQVFTEENLQIAYKKGRD